MRAPLEQLTTLAATVGVHRLTYAEIADTEPLLDELMSNGAAPPTVDWEHLGRVDPIEPATGDRFWQTPVTDAVRIEDEIIVLREMVPIRLTPIGATMWMVARDGASRQDLFDPVVQRHGPHPDAEVLLENALQSLLDERVLCHSPIQSEGAEDEASAPTAQR